MQYLVAALASLPDEPSVARVRIESSGGALGGASSSAPAAAAAGPTGKKAGAPELLRVTGANSRNSSLRCDGDYQKCGTRNGRPCYNKSAAPASGGLFGGAAPVQRGCIYWDGSAWKICQDGDGTRESGWNFSQQVDTPTPPTGAWSGSRAVSESPRCYDDLRVEEISNEVAPAPPTAAAAAAGPINLLRVTGADSRNSDLNCDGFYQKSGTRNGRPCYNKNAHFGFSTAGGCIYWDGSAWKMCKDGNGMTENGWNFSQQVDTPTPPTGAWSSSRAVSEMSRIYDDLRVEEISNGPGAFATAAAPAAAAAAPAAAAAAGPITVSCGVDVGTSERFALADLLGGALGASDKGGGGGAFTTSLLLALASKYSELRSQMYSDGGEKEAAAPPPKERGGKARRGRKGDAAFTRWHSGVDDPKAPGSGDQLEPRSSPLPLWAAHPFECVSEKPDAFVNPKRALESFFSTLFSMSCSEENVSKMIAVCDRNPDMSVRFLSMTDMHGWSALHWAAKRGDVGAIRALVAAGAPIDARAAGSSARP